MKGLIGLARNILHDTIDFVGDGSEKLAETGGTLLSKGSDIGLNAVAKSPNAVYTDIKSIVTTAVQKGRQFGSTFKESNKDIATDAGKAKEYMSEKGRQLNTYLKAQSAKLQLNMTIKACAGNTKEQKDAVKMLEGVRKQLDNGNISPEEVIEMCNKIRKDVKDIKAEAKAKSEQASNKNKPEQKRPSNPQPKTESAERVNETGQKPIQVETAE